MGIAFVAFAPARERARRADCTSKLHQLGIAISLYRQDYGGKEYGTPEQMGLPPYDLRPLLSSQVRGPGSYVSDPRMLECSRAAAQPMIDENGIRTMPNFSYNIWPAWVPERYPQVPEFRKIVRERGPDFPLVSDGWHDDRPRDRPPGDAQFLMILRLDGRVTSGYPTYRIGGWEL